MAKRSSKPRVSRETPKKSSESHPKRRQKPPHEIEVIARAAIFVRGHILLCKNLKHGYFYLPGGHVEPGESAAAAAERELNEECGLRINAGPLALISEGSFTAAKRAHHELNLVFHVKQPLAIQSNDSAVPRMARGSKSKTQPPPASTPPPIRSRESHIAFEWIPLAVVPEFDIRPLATKAWITTAGAFEDAAQPAPEWISEFTPDLLHP